MEGNEAAKSRDESVSRIQCTASVRGKGEAVLSLFRHLAPLTVSAIVAELPLQGRVNIQAQAMACIFASLRVGVEKPRTQYARGEVAFLPSGDLICVCVGSIKSERPLNPVGKVEGGIELFDKLRPGDVLELRLKAA